jgi:hypothetical protein
MASAPVSMAFTCTWMDSRSEITRSLQAACCVTQIESASCEQLWNTTAVMPSVSIVFTFAAIRTADDNTHLNTAVCALTAPPHQTGCSSVCAIRGRMLRVTSCASTHACAYMQTCISQFNHYHVCQKTHLLAYLGAECTPAPQSSCLHLPQSLCLAQWVRGGHPGGQLGALQLAPRRRLQGGTGGAGWWWW